MLGNDDFGPILLYGNDVKNVHDALVSSDHDELALLIASKAKRSVIDHKLIGALPCLDEHYFSVDENPVVSASEQGGYVLVWHWVSNEEAGIISESENFISSA